MHKPSAKRYSIRQVSRLTGVSPTTLRNWERRFGFINPYRSENTFRAYSQDEVALIKGIARQIASGKKISDIAELIRAGEPLVGGEAPPASTAWTGLIDELYRALATFKSERADHLMSSLAMSLTPEQMIERVYDPLLRRVASDGKSLRITAIQEHIVLTTVRMRLCALVNMFVAVSPTSRRFVLAALVGDFLECETLMLACLLKMRGHQVIYLGVNVSIDHLQELDRILQESVFCVTVSASDLANKTVARLRGFRNPAVLALGGQRSVSGPASYGGVSVIVAGRCMEAIRSLEVIGT